LRRVEGRSTFLATRNATIAVAKWGVTREFFLATCNAANVALQVARNIASCNMALTLNSELNLHGDDDGLYFKTMSIKAAKTCGVVYNN